MNVEQRTSLQRLTMSKISCVDCSQGPPLHQLHKADSAWLPRVRGTRAER